MYLWAIPIDAASFVCIAMAIGMSVDYIVHLSHAARFEARHFPGAGVEPTAARVTAALQKVTGGRARFQLWRPNE